MMERRGIDTSASPRIELQVTRPDDGGTSFYNHGPCNDDNNMCLGTRGGESRQIHLN